jgi:hypothetical protein
VRHLHRRDAVIGRRCGGALAAALWVALGAIAAGADDGEVSNFQLMRPVWALGFGDAGWLFDHRGREKHASVAVFPLALADAQEGRQENDTARLTRAVPLYVAERLFLETTCDVTVNMPVRPGEGPIVPPAPLGREELVRLAGDPPPTVLVGGTLAREAVPLVRVTLEVQTPDGRRSTAVTRIGDEPSLEFLHEIVDAAIGFVVDARLCARTRVPPALARPPASHLAPYVNALGQLLQQTFADGRVLPVSSLWSEVGTMAWYERLHTELPHLLAPRLMELRGVLLSLSYGGSEHGVRMPRLLAALEQARTPGDAFGRLAPFVFAKAGKPDACETAKKLRAAERDAEYGKWLATVQCAAAPAR